MITLNDNEFIEIANFMHTNYGINLYKKRHLIQSRMDRILIEKGINYSEYLKLLKSNSGGEITEVINRLTTNHTYFLREPEHFEYLKTIVLPQHRNENNGKIFNVWSAGCSSGEEAYTTAMVLKDFFGPTEVLLSFKIQATDISTKVLDEAREGIYTIDALKNISPNWIKRYFIKEDENTYRLRDIIKSSVKFEPFNLLNSFDRFHHFDLIFCRNVMIYFDQETRSKLINKFVDILVPGGYLFIGHTESIAKGINNLNYIKPSVYRKGL